jgi:hypothetical protein
MFKDWPRGILLLTFLTPLLGILSVIVPGTQPILLFLLRRMTQSAVTMDVSIT